MDPLIPDKYSLILENKCLEITKCTKHSTSTIMFMAHMEPKPLSLAPPDTGHTHFTVTYKHRGHASFPDTAMQRGHTSFIETISHISISRTDKHTSFTRTDPEATPPSPTIISIIFLRQVQLIRFKHLPHLRLLLSRLFHLETPNVFQAPPTQPLTPPLREHPPRSRLAQMAVYHQKELKTIKPLYLPKRPMMVLCSPGSRGRIQHLRHLCRWSHP